MSGPWPSAGLVPFEDDETHTSLESHPDQAFTRGDINRLDSLLLKSGCKGGFPGRDDRKGRAVLIYPRELLFQLRIFRQGNKIHRVRAFAHDIPETIQVLLQLHGAFDSERDCGQTTRLADGLGEFRNIADPGHGPLDERISGSKLFRDWAFSHVVQSARGLAADSGNLLPEGLHGLEGGTAEPFGEGLCKSRLGPQKNKLLAA